MEQGQLTENDITLWDKLYKAEIELWKARGEFLRKSTNKNLIIKQSLNNQLDRTTGLRLLLDLDVKERLLFFDDLVSLASVDHSDVELVWKVILTLPRDFVLANIEKSAEPVLDSAVKDAYVEYRCLLTLYLKIDPYLTYRLAQKALEHEDEDVREAGEDFMDMLREKY
ncbi:MAG TPA: hypothetical protein DDW76_27635 [Cyanobacteria bacterium UBA11369]|nr:hypothetical protein [Cyanobacteria bacterium UBA11371]HBE52440.1 hypothetical protein [Cyanobacteria bacterium UBA11369]